MVEGEGNSSLCWAFYSKKSVIILSEIWNKFLLKIFLPSVRGDRLIPCVQDDRLIPCFLSLFGLIPLGKRELKKRLLGNREGGMGNLQFTYTTHAELPPGLAFTLSYRIEQSISDVVYSPREPSMAINKIFPDTKSALSQLLHDGMTIMAGGFGLCGIPDQLILAIRDSGVKNLTIISNNAGIDGAGLGILLESRQIRKMICSYVGENATFEKQYLAKEIEIEFNPQGTLAERIRAGGAGIPAFFTRTGAGTLVAEGKEVRRFNGQDYIMEPSLLADLAIINAWKGDTAGNLVYRMTARNFNPIMATAAKTTVVQVENLVQPGEINPDHIITPGIYVDRMVLLKSINKRIEQRTTRPRPTKP